MFRSLAMKIYRSNWIYAEINRRVKMKEVACRYGIEVLKNTCLCPFHQENTPSLRLYAHSFYCFGCGAGGDVVSFVARLCGIRNQQAAVRINEDFCLGLNLGEPPNYREQKEWEQKEFHRKEEECWRKQAFLVLSRYRRLLWNARCGAVETPLWWESLEQLEILDYYLDELSRNPEEFSKHNRKEVARIEQRLHCLTDSGKTAG